MGTLEVVVEPGWQPSDSNLRFAGDDVSGTKLVLTRQRCINPTYINSFLTTMRHRSDDIINQRLNDYFKRDSSSQSKEAKCKAFLEKELYHNWNTRNDIINFCEEQGKQMKQEIDSKSNDLLNTNSKPITDSRIDPYSTMDMIAEQQAKYADWKSVVSWVENSRKIENILQNGSNKVLQHSCDSNVDYIQEFWIKFKSR